MLFDFERDGIHADGRVEIIKGRCTNCLCYTFTARRRGRKALVCDSCNRMVRFRLGQTLVLVTT